MASQLNVKLDSQDLEGLRDVAHRRKTTVSWIIRDYVRYLRAGGRPIGFDDGDPTAAELAKLSASSGAFDWLADEPDLYSIEDGEPL